jgi:hypothetical protein
MGKRKAAVATAEDSLSERIGPSGWDELQIGEFVLRLYISPIDRKCYVDSSEAFAFVRGIMPNKCDTAFKDGWAMGWRKSIATSHEERNHYRSFICTENNKSVNLIPLTCAICHIGYKMVEEKEEEVSNWQCLITACRPGTWAACAEQKRILTFSEVSYVCRMYFLHIYFLSLLFI